MEQNQNQNQNQSQSPNTPEIPSTQEIPFSPIFYFDPDQMTQPDIPVIPELPDQQYQEIPIPKPDDATEMINLPFIKDFSKESLLKISDRIKDMTCRYCGNIYSRKYDVRKHYVHCQALTEMQKNHPESIPTEVFNDMETFRAKNAERREQLKRKRESDDVASPSNKTGAKEMAVIKTSLSKLSGEPVAYYPCKFCLRPCANPRSLAQHTLNMHKTNFIDTDDQDNLDEDDTEG